MARTFKTSDSRFVYQGAVEVSDNFNVSTNFVIDTSTGAIDFAGDVSINGTLSLSSDPSGPTEAATKNYVDTLFEQITWNDIVRVSSGPYTISAADEGKLIVVDATAGNIDVNLGSIATLGDSFNVGIKKADASGNVVNVIPDGTDTVNLSAGTISLSIQNEGLTLVSDTSTTPDDWQGFISGSGSGLSFSVFKFMASAGQTIFSGSDANSATLSYTVDNVIVYKNRNKIIKK